VIVKPIREDEVTKSGIVLPDTVDKERPERGEIIAVGEGKILENGQRSPMSVKNRRSGNVLKNTRRTKSRSIRKNILVISQNDISGDFRIKINEY